MSHASPRIGDEVELRPPGFHSPRCYAVQKGLIGRAVGLALPGSCARRNNGASSPLKNPSVAMHGPSTRSLRCETAAVATATPTAPRLDGRRSRQCCGAFGILVPGRMTAPGSVRVLQRAARRRVRRRASTRGRCSSLRPLGAFGSRTSSCRLRDDPGSVRSRSPATSRPRSLPVRDRGW